jgi:hypothetical protein
MEKPLSEMSTAELNVRLIRAREDVVRYTMALETRNKESLGWDECDGHCDPIVIALLPNSEHFLDCPVWDWNSEE